MRWSARTQWDLAETPWAAQLAQLRSAGAELFDLTASNPTRCGFAYDAEAILAPLKNSAALEYEPDPRGLRRAREAVSLYYRDHAATVDPDRIFLTTSTSEAYSFLFRLLCDPGEEVLIGQPGYPLFDFLAQLDDVRLVPYPLFYDHGWHLDLEALRRRVTSRTRAIALVHPNNPTGHFTRPSERAAIEEVCREHGLALIVDEVFLDYRVSASHGQSFATGPHPVPTFVLSGLSKVAALPQMKAAWVACFTADLERLEVISDTFLSMSAPIQHALPVWLNQRGEIQDQVKHRLEANLGQLDQLLLRQTLVTRLEVEAGWYALLRVPEVQAEERLALDLLQKRAVVVHPGGFFGLSGQGWLVVTLLAPTPEFTAGIQAILQHFNGAI
ncbi:MAG TPA: pyridoxal phosphate-dependent aminotransferase [Acidobacteriaceae bacterium]|nr:pyridoxal phosphate-dependent aminotransferase [Acidobacteriaceae bacterium]